MILVTSIVGLRPRHLILLFSTELICSLPFRILDLLQKSKEIHHAASSLLLMYIRVLFDVYLPFFLTPLGDKVN